MSKAQIKDARRLSATDPGPSNSEESDFGETDDIDNSEDDDDV